MTYTSEHPIINVTVDAVVIRNPFNSSREILTIKRKNDPFKGQYALPGGFVNPDETVHAAALRELQEETGVTASQVRHMEALGARSEPGRDPRGPVISLPYLIVVPASTEAVAADDAEDAEWIPIDLYRDKDWAFDHKAIVSEALYRYCGGNYTLL